MVIRDPLDELERPRAHRVVFDIGRDGLRDNRDLGKAVEKICLHRFQLDRDRLVVDDLVAVDIRQAARPDRLFLDHPGEGELDISRGDRGAVVIRQSVSQGEDIGGIVRVFPRLGQVPNIA